MKREDQTKNLADWWRAERLDHHEEAERNLAKLFAGLPSYQPRVGFAERVLAQTANLPRRVPAPPLWLRWSLLAALFWVGSTLPLAKEGLLGLASWIGVADLTSAGSRALVYLVDSWQALAAAGAYLGTLRDGLLTVLAAPPVAASLGTMALLSALAYRGLVAILASPRGGVHV